MKNKINKLNDSQFNFSVVTEDSLMQTYTLNASQAGIEQVLMTVPSHLYVLHPPRNTSLDDALVVERSGEDLLLSLRSHVQSPPALKFDQFFANNGRLHVLKQDGELLRAVMAQDNPQQGQVNLDLQAASAAEKQVISPISGLLLPASESAPNITVAVELAPHSTDAVASVQLSALNVTPLSVKPPQITHVLDKIGAHQGMLTSGNVTDDRYATIEGTGTPGDYLEILDNGEIIGEIRVGSDGRWSFEPEQAYSEAGHILTARVTGTNQSSPSFVLVVDTTAASHTYIDSISDDRVGGQIIARDGHTSDNTPVIKGRAEAFNVVAIYSGPTLIGTSFADASGNWTFSSIFIMPDGEYTISANAIDFSGNTGLPSTSYKFTIDTLPPAVPSIDQVIDDLGLVQGALQSGAVTDDAKPSFSGRSEAGTVVWIYDNSHELGKVQADEDGNWYFTPNEALAEGEHSLTVRAQDVAGNLSDPSDPWLVAVDTLAPDAPTIGGAYDNVGAVIGELISGAVTDDTHPTLTGLAAASTTVSIYDNGNLLGTTIADASGNWSFTPEAQLNYGAHRFTAAACDPAGNMSPPSDTFFDLTISILGTHIDDVLDDVGTIQGSIGNGKHTDDTTPTLSGKGEPGNTVHIYGNHHLLGSVLVGEDGKWEFTSSMPLSEGEHSFTVTTEDKAGHVSQPSDPYVVIIDLTTPTQSATITSIGKDSGFDSTDSLTNDGSAGRLMTGTLSAMLAADERLQVSTDGGLTWVDTLVSGTNWSAQDNNSHDKSWVIQLRVADSAGNTGDIGNRTVELDTVPPVAPLSISVSGKQVSVAFSAQDVQAGYAINLAFGETRIDYVLTQADINAGVATFTSPIPVSGYQVEVRTVDLAGNTAVRKSGVQKVEDFTSLEIGSYKTMKTSAFEIISISNGDGDQHLNLTSFRISDASKEIHSRALELRGGVDYVFNLNVATQNVSFKVGENTSNGSQASNNNRFQFYDTYGKYLGVVMLDADPLLAARAEVQNVSYTAPPGRSIGSFHYYSGHELGPIYVDDVVTTAPIIDLLPIKNIVSSEGAYYGDSGNDIFESASAANVALSAGVHGQCGIDTFKLTGSDQILDINELRSKFSSIEIFDITGTGNNTLMLSLSDALENGGKNLFLTDDKVQLMVKGDSGDKVILEDLLPNGMDLGEWATAGKVNFAGVAYNTYHHSTMNAELFVLEDVAVEIA